MARAINIQPIIEEIKSSLDISSYSEHDKGFDDGLEYVLDLIEKAPTLTPPNEPLTLDELLKMDGEPVYDYLGQEWYVIQEYYDHELTMTDGTRFFDDDEIDGVDKRFYHRPPEGEEGDANRG